MPLSARACWASWQGVVALIWTAQNPRDCISEGQVSDGNAEGLMFSSVFVKVVDTRSNRSEWDCDTTRSTEMRVSQQDAIESDSIHDTRSRRKVSSYEIANFRCNDVQDGCETYPRRA